VTAPKRAIIIELTGKEAIVRARESDFATGRHLEEKYFREKERELIEKLKQKASKEAARKALSEAVGVSDEGILRTLEEMGYDREVVIVLHFFPLVAVAWADGDISKEERKKIVATARAWGVHQGTAADKKLHEWLRSKPDETTTNRALRVIRDIMKFRGPDKQADYHENILQLSEAVADASGGLLGLGRKISAAERKVIERVAKELTASHQSASNKVLAES
jgi:tellurite resistance protein